MRRYSGLGERADRRAFHQRFDFALFNAGMLKGAIPKNQTLIATRVLCEWTLVLSLPSVAVSGSIDDLP